MKTLLAVVSFVSIALTPIAAAEAPAGTPLAPGYITDAQVAAAMVNGGVLLNVPGLTIAAERRTASSTPTVDQTTHHIYYVHDGAATLVTGGKIVGNVIEGGQTNRLKAGDIMTIPAKTPYWWKELPSSIGYHAIHKETPKSGNTWGLPDVAQYIGAERVNTRMAAPGGAGDPLLNDPGVVFYAQRKFKDDSPEIHPNHSHIFILVDGEATFRTGQRGAKIVDGKTMGPETSYQIRPGGIMIVPSGTPHTWVSITNNKVGPKDAYGYIAINMDDPR
jgi:mannose-6-phosphate isomerase-like protein (cupin superfamily)